MTSYLVLEEHVHPLVLRVLVLGPGGLGHVLDVAGQLVPGAPVQADDLSYPGVCLQPGDEVTEGVEVEVPGVTGPDGGCRGVKV